MPGMFCHKCKKYTSKLFGSPRACDYCGSAFGLLPQELAQPQLHPVRESLPQEWQQPVPLPPPQPVPRSVEEPKQEVDGRCALGAHTCKYCEEAFLINEKKTTEEKGKAK